MHTSDPAAIEHERLAVAVLEFRHISDDQHMVAAWH